MPKMSVGEAVNDLKVQVVKWRKAIDSWRPEIDERASFKISIKEAVEHNEALTLAIQALQQEEVLVKALNKIGNKAGAPTASYSHETALVEYEERCKEIFELARQALASRERIR